MSSTWRSNLADAVLLDPLILIHGNVKDVHPLDEQGRSRLPVEMRDDAVVNFDIWLAMEMEAQGFDSVCLYDTISGITLLRRHMLAPFRALLTGQGAIGEPAVARAAVAGGTPPSLSDWLVPLEVKQSANDFMRTLLVNVM